MSASAQVDDGSGNLRPVYNAVPIGFVFNGSNLNDPFDGSQTEPWADLDGGTLDFDDTSEYFVTTTPTTTKGAVIGCNKWKDYTVQTNLKQEAGTTWANGGFMGVILRQKNTGADYYYVMLQRVGGDRILRITKKVGGVLQPDFANKSYDNAASVPIPDTVNPADAFQEDVRYTLKAQISGTDIRVKLWNSNDPSCANPNDCEPTAWELGGSVTPVTDTSLVDGNVGVIATDNIFQFDDFEVLNPDPI